MAPDVMDVGPLSIKSEAECRFLAENPSYADLYDLRFAVRISGYNDVARVACSLERIRRMHGALRTAIHIDDTGTLKQVVFPAGSVPPVVVETGTEKQVDGYLREGLLFGRDVLFDARIFVMADREAIICFRASHLVIDGWSRHLLLAQLAELCTGPDGGIETSSANYQFIDHCRAERAEMASGRLESGTRYWAERMAGAGETSLAPRSGRSQRPPFVSATRDFPVRAELFDRLSAACASRGMSLATVCLSIFNLALFSISGDADVVFATPMLGRTRTGSMTAIGAFSNTTYIRHRIDSSITLEEHVESFRGTVIGALSHQDIFLGNMCHGIALPSMYPTRFNIVQFDAAIDVKGDIAMTSIPVPERAETERELSVILTVAGGRASIFVRFAKNVIPESVVENLHANFIALASTFADSPGRSIQDVMALLASRSGCC